jgi:transposase-like protein
MQVSNFPESLLDACRYFDDLSFSNAYMRRIKWSDGKIACPKCASENIGEITTRSMLKCRDCKKQFSLKSGTIFTETPVPLGSWLIAIWDEVNQVRISTSELGKLIGTTQKTAWSLQNKIRTAMEAA